MGKKSKGSTNNENRCFQVGETTIPLDSTDTDIIECSIVGESKYDFTKTRKKSVVSTSDFQTPKTPFPNKETRKSVLRNSNSLRWSLRKNLGLEEEKEAAESFLQTPRPRKNPGGTSVEINKLISSLKKSPEGPYLSKSKLRNIEQWLKENAVENVITPPFANLSVTPVRTPRLRFSAQCKGKPINDESSIDSEVEGVLKAVYGDDWREKNVQCRAKTEPKKRVKPLSTCKSVKKTGARRNILSGRKLNLSDEENNFDDSFVSGVNALNLNSSGCSDDMAADVLKNLRKTKPVGSSLESLCLPKSEKKKSNKKQTPKPSTVPEKTPKKTFLASLSVSTPTSKCHPEAQYFKMNFKTKKEKLVGKLYKLYNKEVFGGKLQEDMSFTWNVKLRGTAGYCYNKRLTKSSGEVIRLSRIEFSTKIVDRADRLRDTMIHELCHAASWVIDGVLDGHGEIWTKWASTAMKRFPELPLIKRCHNYDIVSKYVYRCTGCGYSIKRHSKSINTDRKRCGHCYGVLELLINKKKKGKCFDMFSCEGGQSFQLGCQKKKKTKQTPKRLCSYIMKKEQIFPETKAKKNKD